MNINLGRMKIWDWGVVAAFIVTIVGVSIPWWKEKVSDMLGGLYESLGDLGGLLPDTAPAAAKVSAYNVLGWDLDAGVAAFVFALFVALWVLAKVLLPADRALPKWYMEAWPVLIIGGILTLIGIIGTADAPGGGYDFWAWRPGGLITLAAGAFVAFCGWMMLNDKSGDYGQSPKPNINITTGGSTPPPSGPTSPGGTPPTAQ